MKRPALTADGRGWKWLILQLEKFSLNFSSCFRASSQKSIFNGRCLFTLCKLRLHVCLPLKFKDKIMHGLSSQP